MRRLIPIVAVVLYLFPLHVEAQSYKTETGHAEFESEVPLHTFTGISDHLVGLIDLSDSTVDFYIDMNTFDTGINKRDKDMRRTLETDKYPFAEFFGKLVSNFDTTTNQPQQVTVRGEFTIHGVTQDLELTGTLQKTADGLKVKASWTLNIEEYDIEPPGILFYRVDENQDIQIEATLTPIESDTDA
ncbi:YceI family protein [Aliifodinibius sp. S!AR15-10]|uniref:YceI family protein n=1 Tax=Aliifodinibius sp. S!AR15-10 TaxID=2950437 RepID=UPI00285D0E42|nr:YceI family protein [Aliifodinibius sp. S!AR15-10]MDR8391018.1 YceI family protein [Aliifodinibius sp. S!AR15-10]